MSANDNKIYYWLKLKKDFFDSHRIKIIEDMPNGKDYVLFYLKLMCEATSHQGRLRFSENIPYSESMLSSLTNTKIDSVHSALEIFGQLDMIVLLDDGTYFLPEVEKLIGKETGQAIRKREALEKAKENEENAINTDVGGKIYPTDTTDEGKTYPRDKRLDIRERKKERDKLSPKKEMEREADSSLSETDTENDTEQQPMTEEEKKINDEHFKKFVNLYPSWKFGNLTMGYVKSLWNAIDDIGNEYPWIMTYVENKLANESRYLPRVDKFLMNQVFKDHDRYERNYNYMTIKEELKDKEPPAMSPEEFNKMIDDLHI